MQKGSDIIKVKSFESVVKELKNLDINSEDDYSPGQDFEKWLKTRKSHLKKDFEHINNNNKKVD